MLDAHPDFSSRRASARATCGNACSSSSGAQGKESSLEYKIVTDHMDDLGKRRFPEIARRMGISVEQVQKCANFIATARPAARAQIFAQAPQ